MFFIFELYTIFMVLYVFHCFNTCKNIINLTINTLRYNITINTRVLKGSNGGSIIAF